MLSSYTGMNHPNENVDGYTINNKNGNNDDDNDDNDDNESDDTNIEEDLDCIEVRMKKERIKILKATHVNDINNRVSGTIDLPGLDDDSKDEDAIEEILADARARVKKAEVLQALMAKEKTDSVLNVTYQIQIDPNSLGTIMKNKNKTEDNAIGALWNPTGEKVFAIDGTNVRNLEYTKIEHHLRALSKKDRTVLLTLIEE